MERLAGKIAIVTGGGTGIGRAVARAFAREGARLVVAGRTRARLDETAAEIQALGAQALAVPTDVTDEAQVMALFEATLQAFGRLDVLVNNAGTVDIVPLEETSLASWRRVLETNLTGPFLCAREAMKIMKRQRGGRIINVGSISAQVPRPDTASYAASKHGLVGLTKSIALEGRAFGIAATCLHPGNTRTSPEMSGEVDEPMMVADDLAQTVVLMASLPPDVTMLEAIVLPIEQLYVGRG